MPRSSKNERKRSRMSAAFMASESRPTRVSLSRVDKPIDPAAIAGLCGRNAPLGVELVRGKAVHFPARRRGSRANVPTIDRRCCFAEQLVGEARERRVRRMSARERGVSVASAPLFVGAAVAVALIVPNERERQTCPLIAGPDRRLRASSPASPLRVRRYCTCRRNNCVFVPMALICAAAVRPHWSSLAAACSRWSPTSPTATGTATAGGPPRPTTGSAVGPVLVLALLAPGAGLPRMAGVYALALVGQLLCDFAWALVRDMLLDGTSPSRGARATARDVARVDAVLSPVALMFAVPAADEPLGPSRSFPLVWLLEFFARDRQARYASALELQRAYRGTVDSALRRRRVRGPLHGATQPLDRRAGRGHRRRARRAPREHGSASSSPRCSMTWARSRSPRRS